MYNINNRVSFGIESCRVSVVFVNVVGIFSSVFKFSGVGLRIGSIGG